MKGPASWSGFCLGPPMDLFHYDPQTMFSFVLTLMRVSMVVFVLPFFGGSVLPNTVKASLCLVLAMAVWPRLSFPGVYMPSGPWELALMFLGEIIIGLLLNILVNFLFAAIQTGGHYMGFAMGFSLMNVVDPLTGVSEAITGHVLYQTSLLLFLSMNGHLFLLQGLSESFQLVPPGGLLINPQLLEHMLGFSAQIFILAVKIASPVMASLFLIDVALALVSRAAPQMNVLFIGFPLKIGVGFLFLTLVFTALSRLIGDYIVDIGPMFTTALRASAG